MMDSEDIGVLIIAIAFIGAFIWFFWPMFKKPPDSKKPPKTGTLDENDW